MCSSPGTPGGTGRPAGSSTYRRMFWIGAPIGTVPASPSHRKADTSTAASVGPYRFHNAVAGRAAANARTASAGSSSPLHTTRRRLVQAAMPSSARNMASIDGTKWVVVTPSRTIRSRRYAASLCPPGLASTSRAPVMSGQKNSHTDTSKLAGVFCSTTSVPSSRYVRCIQSRRLTMPRCVLGTPFGFPVEPDV